MGGLVFVLGDVDGSQAVHAALVEHIASTGWRCPWHGRGDASARSVGKDGVDGVGGSDCLSMASFSDRSSMTI